MHLILKIGISQDTECVNMVGFPKLGCNLLLKPIRYPIFEKLTNSYIARVFPITDLIIGATLLCVYGYVSRPRRVDLSM